MKQVRLGIIGVGNIGTLHIRSLLEGKVKRVELTAISDAKPAALQAFPAITSFSDSRQLIRSGRVDAVLIATPHALHTTIGIDALQQGLHVLVEKPISVHKADCERLIAAHQNPRQIFAAMFNQRTDPFYQKIRQLVQGGELGEVRRINWTITNWFRTEAYYASGGWRATWAGEGGGVLLNQCPHNLDLFQWIFGMPQRVRAFCALGRYHHIEVEDDVTAWFEYPNGTTAVFIASTGEAPGTNRLEVAAERGRLVYENDRLALLRNDVPMSEFSRTTSQGFAAPATSQVDLPLTGHGGQHAEVVQNFVDAILDGQPLLAPAAEGRHSVELANSMLFSSLTGQTVDLPLDAAAYERQLNQLIAGSKFKKTVSAGPAPAADLSASFR